MANYSVDYELFRGEIEDAMAAAEVYIETLVVATAAVIDISVVGDNNYVTIMVLNHRTP